MTRQVEWIGVKSPLQDDRITFRKMSQLYSDEDEVLLEAIAKLLTPLIRQQGSTARALGPNDGLSKHYQWGPRHYIVDMEEIDADRLFKLPDEGEFKEGANPDHDTREPVVPWMYVTQALDRIMKEAANGPGVVPKGAPKIARTDRETMALLDQWATDRIDEAKDRGVTLDDKLRIVRASR